MTLLEQVRAKVLAGGQITFAEAYLLYIENEDVYPLLWAAQEITSHFNGHRVELCAIIPGIIARCSEDCAFCAQSLHHQLPINEQNTLDEDKIIAAAKEMERQGAHRFSIVNSGYSPSAQDFAGILNICSRLRSETSLKLCTSLGVIDKEMALQLKQAGVTMYHHNVETSSSFYPQLCTTHDYQERVHTIQAAKQAGLQVCCGGIISAGENKLERLKMAFEIKDLQVDSVPINILNPIAGTKLANQQVIAPLEILKTIAIFRFVLPGKLIRFAGGRIPALRDLQVLGFTAGINATIIGDYLTTYGRSTDQDLQMLKDLGLTYN